MMVRNMSRRCDLSYYVVDSTTQGHGSTKSDAKPSKTWEYLLLQPFRLIHSLQSPSVVVSLAPRPFFESTVLIRHSLFCPGGRNTLQSLLEQIFTYLYKYSQ